MAFRCWDLTFFWEAIQIILFGEFLYGMCSSHQDCYVHQFSGDYVYVRYRLYVYVGRKKIGNSPRTLYIDLQIKKTS